MGTESCTEGDGCRFRLCDERQELADIA